MSTKIIAAAVLCAMLAACSGGGDEESGPQTTVELEPANPAAGCGGIQRFPNEGATHVEQGIVVQYRTQPPTSGSHAKVWAATGTYAKAIPDEVQTHNLEHGHVVIQYVPGAVPKEIVDGLAKIVRADAKWLILAPLKADGFIPTAAVAFTAWRTGQSCDRPTAAVIDEARAFIKRFKDKGRESVPGDPVRETPPATAADFS